MCVSKEFSLKEIVDHWPLSFIDNYTFNYFRCSLSCLAGISNIYRAKLRYCTNLAKYLKIYFPNYVYTRVLIYNFHQKFLAKFIDGKD